VLSADKQSHKCSANTLSPTNIICGLQKSITKKKQGKDSNIEKVEGLNILEKTDEFCFA
jgi:hypothetical protein